MTGKSGFSMIEVMIATAVLLLGTVMIHESYLRAADLFGRYSDTLKVRLWMNGHLWDIKENLIYSPSPSEESSTGSFTDGGKNYNWSQDIRALSNPKFYDIRLSVNWNEGNQPFNLIKETYAFRKEISQQP